MITTPQKQTELKNFILWFLQIEDIPVTTRRDMAKHILDTGTIDDKTQKFIDDTLEYLVKTQKAKVDNLKQQLDDISAALDAEQNPATSLEERDIKEAEEEILRLASDFKEDYRAFEHQENTKAESQEETQNEAEIAALKANL